ncbi:MAG: nicotinate (nicotinamide) nucleotide adenylyltransferase [Chloroflexi bacterium]|nr:MAG: nicotinate (nicotinamide) nucleotide adenylyltransferase [Chloroflexota bacterium]
MERIGLLGGTFDPPHVGHLWLAETARDQLALDRVLFLPVGQPPHKRERPISPAVHRLAMIRLAVAHIPWFMVDTTDLDRPPPHTTVTLLPLLAEKYPNAHLWLLLGGDSLRDLPTWHKPDMLVRQCRLGVLARPGAEVDWSKLETAVPGVTAVTDLLDGPTINLSATEIRRWVAAGHSIQHLVPPAVCRYIQQNRLYQPKA